MNKAFTDIGWEDYLYWQTEDRKTLRKINTLLKDIERNGNVIYLVSGGSGSIKRTG